MILDVLTPEDAEQIRLWRNETVETLRTPVPLTEGQQQDWYMNVVENRNSDAYWWAVREDGRLLGYTGIQHVDWVSSHGEISLLIGTPHQGAGYGSKASELVLAWAFRTLNLHMVWGESYPGSQSFWVNLVDHLGGSRTMLRDRTFKAGQYQPALYFSITRDEFENAMLHSSESRKQAVSR